MPQDMNRWRQYLFESHSEATLQEWARRLRFFRFFRAYGGHANDGDSLDVVYEYRSVEDLYRFFAHLGIPITSVADRPRPPESGVACPPSLIPGTSLKQPGHCFVTGQKVFVWCETSKIKISLGADYRVTEAHVQAAEAIEVVLSDAPLLRIDPPVDNEHCICPKYYPAYFS